jgi:hypothetical protein
MYTFNGHFGGEILNEPTTINDSESSCSEVATCFTLKTINEGLELAFKLDFFLMKRIL